MRERRYTILSTAALPFERIGRIPDSIDIRILPFTEIIPRTDESIKVEIASLSTKNITAVFTSAHAVNFVSDLLPQKPDWKVYSIGNETRTAVSNRFGNNSIVNFANNALDLSKFMIADEAKEAVFFCSAQRMDILPDELKKHGIELTELIVYDTRLTPRQIADQPDAILFFSPTAVRSFFSINKLSAETAVFVMGKTTAAALNPFKTGPVMISPEPDKAFVFKMATEYAAAHPIT